MRLGLRLGRASTVPVVCRSPFPLARKSVSAARLHAFSVVEAMRYLKNSFIELTWAFHKADDDDGVRVESFLPSHRRSCKKQEVGSGWPVKMHLAETTASLPRRTDSCHRQQILIGAICEIASIASMTQDSHERV